MTTDDPKRLRLAPAESDDASADDHIRAIKTELGTVAALTDRLRKLMGQFEAIEASYDRSEMPVDEFNIRTEPFCKLEQCMDACSELTDFLAGRLIELEDGEADE